MEEIKNRVLKQELVDWRSLEWIQGQLKDLTEEGFEKLIKSIVENDIIKAFHVWENEGKLYCLDGNHLKKALEAIEKRKLKKVPGQFKADFIDCKDMKEAKQLVLIYSAVYAKITDEGLYDFLHSSELIDDWDLFKGTLEIPGIDMEGFELGWLSNEHIIDEIPDVDIQGEVENKGEYIIIQFSDLDEFERIKEQLGLKAKTRVIEFGKVREIWGIV